MVDYLVDLMENLLALQLVVVKVKCLANMMVLMLDKEMDFDLVELMEILLAVL